MSSKHEEPITDPTIENYKVPHSGINGVERPVEEFDTSLSDAHDEGSVTSDSIIVTDSPPAHDRLSTPSFGEKAWNYIKGHPKKVGGVVLTLVLAAGSGPITKAINSFGEGAGEGDRGTTVSGPEKPGPVETEPASGIALTSEQVAAYNSGDQAAIDKVNEKVLKPKLQEVLLAIYYEQITGEPVDFSSLTSDPEVEESLRTGVLKNIPEPSGTDPFQYGVEIAPMIETEEVFGGPFEDRLNTGIVPGEPLINVKTALSTPDDPGAKTLPNRQTIDFDRTTVVVDGDTLRLIATQ